MPGPPNLGLSRHSTHSPQSGRTEPPRRLATFRPSEDPDADDLVRRLRQRAERALESEDPRTAVRSLEAALCLAPEDAAIRERASAANWLAGEHDRALELLDDLVAHGAAGPRVHEQRALILIATDRLREAADAFQRAALAPGAGASTFNGLGVALFELGDHAGAAAAFDEALRRDPDHVDARNNRDAMRGGSGRNAGSHAARN